MAPPLVAKLMRGYVVAHIQFIGLMVEDKADGLGKRNGIRERLREIAVFGELDDAHLLKQEGIIIIAIILQAAL